MKSPTPEPLILKSFQDLLKTFCASNKVGFPFYESTVIEPHRHKCRCHVLVLLDSRQEFWVVIAYGESKELVEEKAAKTMRERLISLLKVPAMIVQQKSSKMVEIENEKKIVEEKTKQKRPPEAIIQPNYYDNDGQYCVKSSTTSESSSSSESTNCFVGSSSLSTNHGVKRKHDADIQLEKIQQLMPRETASKIVESGNHKKIGGTLKKTGKIIEKNTKCAGKKEDDSEKKSNKEKSDETRILSKYHNQMLNIFGHDSRKRYISQEITKLSLSVIQFETRHMHIIDKPSSYLFPFQTYINHLDTIMLHVNVGVESSIFVANDGQFIRVIRVTTVPEIVEVETGRKADCVGVKAFHNVIQKLKKLMA